ncbi:MULTISPECIES: ketoacyl-ACP synthase III family protein [Streptomyces]|uniref:ketoacyl-ACP synthase III family protein n=1 Tax=Streptomyces TaxID=1883 RepID=UPI003D74CEF1
MRCDNPVYIASAATWLPDLVPLGKAVEEGLVDAAHQDLGYTSIAVAEGIVGPDMAIQAADRALKHSAVAPEDVGLVLHSSCWFQGLDMWTPASYIASRTVGPYAVPFDLGQKCNGGMGALHLATAYVSGGFAEAALLTTGDCFAPPMLDRWNMQLNMIIGDAGTALVVSRRAGFARILATAVGADSSLEPWFRGDAPFRSMPGQENPVRVIERGARHAVTPEAVGSWERYEAGLLRTAQQALTDAGLTRDDISRVIVPFMHRGQGQAENYDVLGFPEERSLWEFGRRVGHLGAGDQFAGLDYLCRTDAVTPGEAVLLVGSGPGFTFASAVVEIVDTP